MIQNAIEILESDWSGSHDWDTAGAFYTVKGTYDDPYFVFMWQPEGHPAIELAERFDKGERIQPDDIGICILMEAWQMKTYEEIRDSDMYEFIRDAVLSQTPEQEDDPDAYFKKLWNFNLESGNFRPSQAPDLVRREIRSILCVLSDNTTWEYRRYRDTNETEWLCMGETPTSVGGRVVDAMREYLAAK